MLFSALYKIILNKVTFLCFRWERRSPPVHPPLDITAIQIQIKQVDSVTTSQFNVVCDVTTTPMLAMQANCTARNAPMLAHESLLYILMLMRMNPHLRLNGTWIKFDLI